MADVATFVEQLEQIPWLENLGKPSPRDNQVIRIYSWDEWPGPEDPGSEAQAQCYMEWHDAILRGEPTPLPEKHRALFDTIRNYVIQIVREKVPYEEDEDAWYAPNAAAWSAGEIAGIVGCMIAKHGQLLPEPEDAPPESQWTLAQEWSWYQEGHWPCAYYWLASAAHPNSPSYWPNKYFFPGYDHTDLHLVARTGDPRKLVVF